MVEENPEITRLAEFILLLWKKTGHANPVTRKGFDLLYKHFDKMFPDSPRELALEALTRISNPRKHTPYEWDSRLRASAKVRSSPLFEQTLRALAIRSGMYDSEIDRMFADIINIDEKKFGRGLTNEERDYLKLMNEAIKDTATRGYYSTSYKDAPEPPHTDQYPRPTWSERVELGSDDKDPPSSGKKNGRKNGRQK